jgi:hypothetical protein
MNTKPYNVYSEVGTFIDSKLLTTDPAKDKEFRHLDYYPMINARAHSIGDSVASWTLNKNLKETYERLLNALIELQELTAVDKMNLAYYLQLQERISEAISVYKTIDLKQSFNDSTLQIQYDYMSAYFDFFIG